MYKKIMLVVWVLIVLGLMVGSIVAMPKEKYPFSENENRYLATFPEISLDNLKSKKFMEGFDKWTSDMFLGREEWIQLKNQTERLIGKMEVSGVYTYDDRMMQVWNDYNEEDVELSLAAMNAFAERHDDVPMYFMLAPTSQEIYKNTLPANAIVGDQKQFISECYNSLTAFSTIDVTPTLQSNQNLYIYYRTDHHWTSLGAYLSYVEASKKMGFSRLDIGRFNIEHAANNFRGTLYSKTLDKTVTPDIMDYYILETGDPKVNVSVLGVEDYTDYDSMYFREYLSQKDKYSSFLGQNTPIMKIKTELDGNDSKLLIFKDSYAHSLIPFLSKNYSEIVVCDMRYINVDYHQYIKVEEFDQVLFLYNVITFSEDTHIRKLNLGK